MNPSVNDYSKESLNIGAREEINVLQFDDPDKAL